MDKKSSRSMEAERPDAFGKTADGKPKAYDPDDEHGANKTAQIGIAAASVIYLGILVMTLMDWTRFSIKEYLILLGVFVAALLANIILRPLLDKKAPWLNKYFLVGALFVACISIQATTQLFGALFLAFPILLACRYHDRKFLRAVVVTAFLSVIAKELICKAIGTYDLNVISVLDGTTISDGAHFQSEVMRFVDKNTYFRDISIFSVIPQWIQLCIITTVASLLANNGRVLRARELESIRREAQAEREMESAKDIQMGLLPDAFDIGEGFDLFASSVPAKNVGGDFYDCYMIDDTHLAITIADVSGKGMPAALFMATTKMCIRDYVMIGLDAGEALTRVNRAIGAGNKQGMFVTAWLGVLDLSSGVLRFVNAGHNLPLLRKNDGEYRYLCMKRNLILGALDDFSYTDESMTLEPGDSLLFYTDGVTEARNTKNELFGDDRLRAFMNGLKSSGSEETVRAVNEEVVRFTGDAEPYDDVTLLALRYDGPAEEKMSRIFPAEEEEYPAVKAFVEEAMESFGASDDASRAIHVAADELFTNVAKYSYPDRDGEVELRLIKKDETISMCVIDSGIPFNPLTKKQENVVSDEGEIRIGGLGISVVKQLMDDFCYSYVEEKNIVTVTKAR